MFSLYSKLAAAIVLALFLAGLYWRGHTQGYKARDAIAQVEEAQRTAQALEASEAARKVEQELSAKVGRIDRAYQDQKRATQHVAAAVAVGMRELETALATAPAASSCPADTSGIAGTDPRPTIARECARQLGALDEAYGKLADKARALQEVASVMCVAK
jgi:hypothetical protein